MNSKARVRKYNIYIYYFYIGEEIDLILFFLFHNLKDSKHWHKLTKGWWWESEGKEHDCWIHNLSRALGMIWWSIIENTTLTQSKIPPQKVRLTRQWIDRLKLPLEQRFKTNYRKKHTSDNFDSSKWNRLGGLNNQLGFPNALCVGWSDWVQLLLQRT